MRFIQKEHVFLKGRYREHIIQNSLPEEMLDKPLRPAMSKKHGLDNSEEQWSRISDTTTCTKKITKYFDAPKNIPTPKQPSDKKHKSNGTVQCQKSLMGTVKALLPI